MKLWHGINMNQHAIGALMTRRQTCLNLQTMLLSLTLPFTTAQAAPPAPYSLLMNQELEQVIGKLKGAPQTDKEGDASWCNYEFANEKDAMEVWVFPDDAIDHARKRTKKSVVVKGLGDDQARLPVCW